MKKQVLKNYIGIWMDHAEAKLIPSNETLSVVQIIHSGYNSRVRIDGESGDGIKLGGFRSTNDEYSKHAKKQNVLNAYYKQLAAALQTYDEILVFGPTTAPKEFANFLAEDKHFAGKTILTKQEDYLTENQILEYVRKYFK